MASNILTGKPESCADGVLTGSKHLGSSLIGQASNTISPVYVESTVELGKKATPKDCAACINKLGNMCMLNIDPAKLRGDAIQATHSNLIAHDPRERLTGAYDLLEAQAAYFDLRNAEPEEDLVRVATDLAESGLSPDKLAEIGLPEIDPEAIQDQAA